MDGGVKLRLGVWLKDQRRLQKSELLDAKKANRRLESIGVTPWNDKKHETAGDRFDRNFDLLVAFGSEKGTCGCQIILESGCETNSFNIGMGFSQMTRDSRCHVGNSFSLSFWPDDVPL
jgi:hypothetical protein